MDVLNLSLWEIEASWVFLIKEGVVLEETF
jgi:hypothetical protein